jgi:hypothetical protein
MTVKVTEADLPHLRRCVELAALVLPLAITQVVPDLVVAGPVPDLAEQVRDLHRGFRSA